MARTIPRGWQELEIKDFLKFTPREIEKPKVKYRSLGIRSHCKGTFLREVDNPDKVMMETLYAVKKDDLIVNITFAWEGAVALVNKSDEGALVSHRFPTYVFNRNMVIPEFFRYLIPSKRFVYNLGVISPGGAGRNRVLDRKDFMHLQFIMPPVAEQKKIAEILLAWDQAIETLSKLIEAKTKLKKGLMQKVLTGKKRLCGFKEKWHIKRLDELGSFLKGKGLSKEDISSSGKIRAIPYTAIYTDFSEIIKYEQINTFTSSMDIFVINSPHVLIAGSSNMLENIGKATAYNDHKEVAIGGDVILYKTNSDVRFIAYLLNTIFHRKRIIALSQGVTIRHVYPSTFYNYEIEVPTFAEQTVIADMHMTVDKDISLLKQMASLLKEQKKGLMQKLLTGKIRIKV
jgi:type I restriction enzyme S subunit